MTNLFFYDLNKLPWENIPWQDLRLYVFKIQTQIYKAAYLHQYCSLKKLQAALLQDYGVRLLSLHTVVNYVFVKKKLNILVFRLSISKLSY